MTDPTSQSNTRVVMILLATGVVILAVAGYLLLRQRTSTPPPPEQNEPAPELVEAPAPLVVAKPSAPLNEEADAGPEEVEDKKPGNNRPKAPKSDKFGTIDAKAVNQFMNARFGAVKACYERRLKTNSFLEGIYDLNIEIKSTGKVSGISVNKDTVRDPEMMACVKKIVRGWHFPKPDDGRVIVAKTFNFKKAG